MNTYKVKSSLIALGIACVVLYLSYFVVSQISSKSNKVFPVIVMKQKDHQKKLPVSKTEDSIAEFLVRESSGMFCFFTKPHFSPKYLYGDFNGDGNTDLAIFSTLNSNTKFDINFLSAFKINTLYAYDPKNNSKDVDNYPREYLKNYTNSPILVIFHGVNGASVNNFKIKDRFICLDSFPTHPDRMLLFNGKFKTQTIGDELESTPPPSLVGDSIVVLNEYGSSGTAIVWYKGEYYWYPVEDFE